MDMADVQRVQAGSRNRGSFYSELHLRISFLYERKRAPK